MTSNLSIIQTKGRDTQQKKKKKQQQPLVVINAGVISRV